VISDWLVPLYQRIRPLMPEIGQREGDVLIRDEEFGELLSMTVEFGAPRNLLTEYERSQALAVIDAGASYRKVRPYFHGLLEQKVVAVA
jgi:hypothetical protein